MNVNFFQNYFSKIADCVSTPSEGESNFDFAVELLHSIKAASGKVIVVGNGGSAAMASHVTVDLIKAAKFRAMNFNEASLVTCFANDYGYENWVDMALKAYADPKDLVMLISSSGKSPNIVNGARRAREMNLKIITFSGFSDENPLRTLGDFNFWANSNDYNVVEMTHHIWLLALVDKCIADNTGA
jgi:D-sedoheptulose 7-phosphate isomerase